MPSEEGSNYRLTRLGAIIRRLLNYPLDVDKRDEIHKCISLMAIKGNGRVILEEDFMDLANLISEKLECIEEVQAKPQREKEEMSVEGVEKVLIKNSDAPGIPIGNHLICGHSKDLAKAIVSKYKTKEVPKEVEEVIERVERYNMKWLETEQSRQFYDDVVTLIAYIKSA